MEKGAIGCDIMYCFPVYHMYCVQLLIAMILHHQAMLAQHQWKYPLHLELLLHTCVTMDSRQWEMQPLCVRPVAAGLDKDRIVKVHTRGHTYYA